MIISKRIRSIQSKNITINNYDKDEVSIFADYTMIFSVLRNVISNAIKFTESKGLIEIRTKEKENFVLIEIKDNGTGINPDKMDNLFSLQEKKSSLGTDREKGTGLGLVLVKEFIDLNKGKITIESSSNGTFVLLSLPKNNYSSLQ
jgi:signal transduction histidine kinase